MSGKTLAACWQRAAANVTRRLLLSVILLTRKKLAHFGALAFTLGTSCTPAGNPVLVVPPPPLPLLTLSGVIWSESHSAPISGAQILLTDVTLKADARRARRIITAEAGAFLFDSLRPGHYEVATRAIGFRTRADTLFLHAAPGLTLRVPMVMDTLCLDVCPPNAAKVAAAWAGRDRWVCDRDRESIAHARAGWLAFFSGGVHADDAGSLPDPVTVAKRLRHVKDDSICRRAAHGRGSATSLAFTVFRVDGFWLISEPGFDTPWVLDSGFKPIRYAGFMP